MTVVQFLVLLLVAAICGANAVTCAGVKPASPRLRESQRGGDMVVEVLRQAEPHLPVRPRVIDR